MIYGRFGEELTLVRVGTLDDVRTLDRRKPDQTDRDAIEAGSYVVGRDRLGRERLYHQGFLRADRGSLEIGDALAAVQMFPKGECWIGTTRETPPKWEVSNGPTGERSHADEFSSPELAIDHARKLGLRVLFEEDFSWGDTAQLRAERDEAREVARELFDMVPMTPAMRTIRDVAGRSHPWLASSMGEPEVDDPAEREVRR